MRDRYELWAHHPIRNINPPAEAAYIIRENFGPLRAVFKYQDLNEAVRLANGTPYGLGASVWGTDPESLDAVARRLDAGTVWINQHLNVHPNVPFSGQKNSAMCRSLRTDDRR